MSMFDSREIKAILWTTIIAFIPFTVINQLFSFLNKSVNRKAVDTARFYFSDMQPDFFPLLYILVLILAILAIVTVYSIVYSRLPRYWMFRGILIGLFLFFVVELPFSIQTGYTTTMPMSFAWGMAFFGLAGDIVNGCVIAYIHMRLIESWSKKKEK